jgi:hypothetical protein
MALISTYTAVVAVVSFVILWGGIHFLSRWIPPQDEPPAWKTGVMAAVIVVFSTLFIQFLLSFVNIGG